MTISRERAFYAADVGVALVRGFLYEARATLALAGSATEVVEMMTGPDPVIIYGITLNSLDVRDLTVSLYEGGTVTPNTAMTQFALNRDSPITPAPAARLTEDATVSVAGTLVSQRSFSFSGSGDTVDISIRGRVFKRETQYYYELLNGAGQALNAALEWSYARLIP